MASIRLQPTSGESGYCRLLEILPSFKLWLISVIVGSKLFFIDCCHIAAKETFYEG